ncbi:MAG: hypothetical protein M1817_005147 [Caeruleum heppii]|nr:MAG: hypothetical protein M1817_005147 [Caeruleum heppii]
MAPLFRSILFFFFTSWLLASGHGYTITGPTGGVNGQTGQRPFRQDFRTFQNSGAAFDLFVLAWQRFQQQNQTELLSYFQVSGTLSEESGA